MNPNHPLPAIAVVTDSTCDLTPELAEANHVYPVPAILVINGQSLKDGADISRQDFYTRLPSMNPLPTTSAPASGAFHELYERLFLKGYQQIISVHAASQLSGIYNAARLAAQEFGDRIRTVDSGQVSMGLGFQALAAAEAIRSGASLEKAIASMRDVGRRLRVFAMLDSLEYVRRSGRVSWAKASLGALLNLKLFIDLKDGIVRRIGEARTRRKGIERLLEILAGAGKLEKLAILHTNAEQDAAHLLAQVSTPTEITPIVNVTTVIGTHVGPNALGFAVVLR
jgi:DegV family protein with EDD domain